MYCEECGGSMLWRCTDTRTNISKFKCSLCGHIQSGVLDIKPPLPKPKPKYYYLSKGKYYVKRTINRQLIWVGVFEDEENAKKAVCMMEEHGWDKSMVPRVKECLA